MELGRTYRGLGDIIEVKGDLKQTIDEYYRSLQIFEQVAGSDPTGPDVQTSWHAYETMADGHGHAAKAEAIRLTNYQKSFAIRERLLGKDPAQREFAAQRRAL